jgi:hypothetical protein
MLRLSSRTYHQAHGFNKHGSGSIRNNWTLRRGFGFHQPPTAKMFSALLAVTHVDHRLDKTEATASQYYACANYPSTCLTSCSSAAVARVAGLSPETRGSLDPGCCTRLVEQNNQDAMKFTKPLFKLCSAQRRWKVDAFTLYNEQNSPASTCVHHSGFFYNTTHLQSSRYRPWQRC